MVILEKVYLIWFLIIWHDAAAEDSKTAKLALPPSPYPLPNSKPRRERGAGGWGISYATVLVQA